MEGLCVALSRDGEAIATGGMIQGWKIRRVVCGSERSRAKLGTDKTLSMVDPERIRSIAFSACGKRVVTGSEGGLIVKWDASTGDALGMFVDFTVEIRSAVVSLQFSPDGRRLASGNVGALGCVRVWDDSATGGDDPIIRVTASSWHYQPSLSFMSWSSDGERIYSCGASLSDHTAMCVFIWEVATGACIATLTHTNGIFNSVAASSDGSSIAAAGTDRCVAVWDAGSFHLRFKKDGHHKHTACKCYGAVSENEWVDMEPTKRPYCPIVGHRDTICSLLFSPCGQRLVSGGDDGHCLVWCASSGELLGEVGRPAGLVKSLCWVRDYEQIRARRMAFAMGEHERLGAVSAVHWLEAALVRAILAYGLDD